MEVQPSTSSGLGTVRSDGYEMNTCFTTSVETESLLNWFNAIWSNGEVTGDVKPVVLAQLETIFADKSPEFVYFLTLYNIFRDYLVELEEDKIIKTKTGIKDTLVWASFTSFNVTACWGPSTRWKNITAASLPTALDLEKPSKPWQSSKYYELRNDRVLVLCPKKLRENWTLLHRQR